MQAKDYIGKRMVFTGADDIQAKWTGNADPRSFFVEGDVATVRTINIGGWSSTLEFEMMESTELILKQRVLKEKK